MKSICKIIAGAVTVASLASQAETLISSRTITVPVDISSAKVVLTNKGYGTAYLVKVLVPTLAEPTLMNHRNDGETAPCLATYQTNKIDDVVQGHPETVNADMKIDLTKDTYVQDNVCHVLLREDISTVIRGFTFVHSRSSELPTRDPGDCQ